jgi:UDP-N-acetylmuramoyl-tripeptide--D-alanyl-D-alanine ligase
MILNIFEFVDIIHGKILKKGKTENFKNFVIDSRKVDNGSLFFGIKGEKTNGFNYIKQALNSGACGVVVEKTPLNLHELNGFVILVENCTDALYNGAKLYRKQLKNTTFIAVTGSCGKTSTKEILKSGLEVNGITTCTKGNFNNHFGVPLTLSSFSGNEKFGVIELGMNSFGEIESLAKLAKPHVGIITAITPVHLEGVGSIEGVRKAKGELIKEIDSDGVIVLPSSEKWLIEQAKLEKNLKILTFGEEKTSDIQLLKSKSSFESNEISFLCQNIQYDISIPLSGKHQALNCIAAILGALCSGVDIDSFVKGLKNVTLPGERNKIEKFGEYTIFNDCYNSSPSSVRAVLEMVQEMFKGDIHLVLGDMLELGNSTHEFHKEMGNLISSSNFKSCSYIGNYGESFLDGVLNPEEKNIKHLKSYELCAKRLKSLVKKGDLIVIKGSRGVHLEKVIFELKQ